MATDNHENEYKGVSAPGTPFNITPADGADLTYLTRAIYIGVAGDIKIDDAGGTTLTLALDSGWHPIRVARVYSTDTTATGIIGLR